jgi:hypothetical protein
METEYDRKRPGPAHYAVLFFTATTVVASVMAYTLNQRLKAETEALRASSARIELLEGELQKCRGRENAGN